jgi:hypothetical protein
VGPEVPKNIPSSQLWEVTGRWAVSPDDRPAAAALSWSVDIAVPLIQLLQDLFRSRLSVQIKILPFRHQLAVYQRMAKRPPIRLADRILWACLSRRWSRWRVEAFPWQDPPKYLLRDRDETYGTAFKKRVTAVGFTGVLTAARSPWRSPYVESLIGTIRRDGLDHVIVVNERHLRRILADCFTYYDAWRTHLSLEMDCPEPREIQAADRGDVVEFPETRGLLHHYQRVAA